MGTAVLIAISWLALALALVALARSLLPPQTRAVHDLAARVELLELRMAQLGEGFTKRERRQLAEDARAAKAEKAQQRETLAEEALALLQQQAQQVSQQPAQPESREQLRSRLRTLAFGSGNSDPRRH